MKFLGKKNEKNISFEFAQRVNGYTTLTKGNCCDLKIFISFLKGTIIFILNIWTPWSLTIVFLKFE